MKVINYNPKYKVMFLALLIGLITGVVSIAFNKILNIGFDVVSEIYKTKILMFIIPAAVASIIGFIRHRLLKDGNQGFGVSQVMYEIEHINTPMMKPLGVFYKIIGTFLTLVAGFSAGRQGPIVHLGGAIGSNIAYRSNLDNDAKRVLIGCGVAGCLAGIFNSPIFATLFVVEILFKKRYFDMLSTILLSALSSTIVVRVVTEETFFSSFQTNYSFHLSELTNFILVGLIVGLVSVIYIISLRYTKHFFDNLKVPQFVRNLFGALLIGCMLYFFSDYYLYNPTPDVITLGNYSAGHLYIISILIIILTSITIGTGGIGGIFTPGLMIGLTFGLALSKTFINLGLPLLDVNTYALAGMAAMFAGFAIAPLSAALMIVEMTNQYNLLFPILISSLIASKISEIIVHDSIYHQNLDSLLSRDHLNDQ